MCLPQPGCPAAARFSTSPAVAASSCRCCATHADCTTDDERRTSAEFTSSTSPLALSPAHLLTADAHALPLVDGCCAAACCIAAWSLFADPPAVLRELRRVVAPGGPVLIVSGTQAWAHVTRWPPALADQLQAALARAHAGGMPWPSAPDVGDELTAQFAAAGMPVPRIRAFLLDLPDPARAALALLPWRQIRAVVAPFLQDSTLRAADHGAVTGDVELCTLALAAQATRPREDFITQRQLRAC
jgi:SAM-dependent methyltransferase